jgi:alcohol dehydrogenase class IV
MSNQRVLQFDEVHSLNPHSTAIWATPSVRTRVESELPLPVLPELQPLPADIGILIVIGGGTLMDEAKVWRLENAPELQLIAIPSIWGSGAEASPVAVRNREGKKDIRVNPKLVPDARAIWPELAATISPELAKRACGDCWSHALEGFLSPLATDELRTGLAALMQRMLSAQSFSDPSWFEWSAQASAGQARSSVGLIHGIAHTLEGIMTANHPGEDWGHARLCMIFLLPVMSFNAQASDKWSHLTEQHGLPSQHILDTLRKLFDSAAYAHVLPVLKENWIPVLRDACSRTNSALVRPASVAFFAESKFP